MLFVVSLFLCTCLNLSDNEYFIPKHLNSTILSV
jgi:hypothetical protein